MAKRHDSRPAHVTPRARRKSLQDLDGEEWGEAPYPSHVVTTVHRLRRVPLQDFTVEDLRLMIGQDVGLAYLVPLAVERLRADPLVAGDFYPGDLLTQVLRVAEPFWTDRPDLHREVVTIADHALALLSERDDDLSEDLAQAIHHFRPRDRTTKGRGRRHD